MYAQLKDNRVFLFDSFKHKESIKEMRGRTWHPEEKAWSVPIDAENLETLDLLGCEFSEELKMIKKSNVSNASEGAVLPVVSMPIRATPYAHQIKAFNFACEIMELTGGDAQ